MAKRGRPTEEIVEHPTKWVDIYDEVDGTKTKWTWDKIKSPNAPLSVEVIYPKDWDNGDEDEEIYPIDVPKTKRKYWNPASEKYVGYTRARALGLIK